MMYPDDLAYLEHAITTARDYGKMGLDDLHKMPPFIFDYLMTARLFHTLVAVGFAYLCFRLSKRMWKAHGWTWIAYCGSVGVMSLATFMQATKSWQAWMHPAEWMVAQFIQFN